jgi:hypothetical protein
MQARIWNNSTWISECEPAVLKERFDTLLRECGFQCSTTQSTISSRKALLLCGYWVRAILPCIRSPNLGVPTLNFPAATPNITSST